MKKLPLHDLIIKNNLVNALLSIKAKGVKHVAMDGDGKIHAFIKDNFYYSENCAIYQQWVTDFDRCILNEHYFLIGIINPDTINPKDSFEEIDWDYLAGVSSDKSKYDMNKLGDLYQALLDGYIIKSWSVEDGYSNKLIKFDKEDQKFKVSSDNEEYFWTLNVVNKLFLDNNEIYTPPKERLWIYYDYDNENEVVFTGSKFIPIDQVLTNEDGYTWFRTEEVR